MYDAQMVAPMRAELADAGVEELKDAAAVVSFIDELREKKIRSAVLFVNSVCGCAAGVARPGFMASLSHKQRGVRNATVFAGVDKEATAQARKYMEGVAASSPSIGFFREGELVYFIDRHNIEGNTTEDLEAYIGAIYEKFFGEQVDENKEVKTPSEAVMIEAQAVLNAFSDGNETAFLFYDCRDAQEREQQIANLEKNEEVKIRLLQQSALLDQKNAEDLVARRNENEEKTVVFFSNHGQRSLHAVQYFKKHGFSDFKSLKGGLTAL